MERTVDICPRNLTETVEASTKLGCGRDKYGNDQYMCLPNVETTSLVEFCHDGIMGFIERGNCLKTAESKIFTHKCSNFVSSCPDVDFRSNEIYKYPACQNISTEHRCYLADPYCENLTLDISTKDTAGTTNHVIYSTTAMNIQTTEFQEDDSTHIWAIVGILVAVLVLILLLIIGRVVLKRMHRKRRKEKNEFLTEEENLLRETKNKVVQGATKREETGCKSKQIESVNNITEIDICTENQEMKHCIAEVCDCSELKGKEIGDTETRIHNEPNDKNCGITEASLNWEPVEIEHNMSETGVHSKPNENEHSISITDVSGKLQEREHDATEGGVNSESEEWEYGALWNGIEKEDLALFQRKENEKYTGEYNVWKTKIADQFSTLTNDEVSVLFCFLCSDTGHPNFTDTKWLYILNKIRLGVHGRENRVTREEAQQTLDRLKSRDYLWEDQDKITRDTKDETMYRIAAMNSNIPLCYSSYNTANVYLRSQEYNRKPGEKCVISPPFGNFLLIHRLQMNILTHVTMEDTRIHDMIHTILNISDNVQLENEVQRKDFLRDLNRGAEAVHFRGRSHDSVHHLKTCIGLHPHWDIYIIDNKVYRKTSKCHNYSPKIRNLLYSILLVKKYQLNLSEESHRIIRDKIRDRYFNDVTGECSVDLPGGITETRDGVITFISDDIRHDVMYAFVTECLVEYSDLEIFLTTASRDVISEYCRSYNYNRSEGERCLYLPYTPGKMLGLFIDKLQLDIITHCTVSDENIYNNISTHLGVPREVLKWDQDARERYVEYAKRGTQTVHHARGMIVGCAGAGKTTLLKRLFGCSEEDIRDIKSTEGLEVHEEIFELCDETKSLKALTGMEKLERDGTSPIFFETH